MARRLGVTRDDVVDAAVRITDRDGLDGLTVAAVAGEVGCRPPSVYHHVAGLDGLVRAVAGIGADGLAAAVGAAADGNSGRDSLTAMAHAALRWSDEHRGRFEALCRPVDGEVDGDLAARRRSLLDPARRALADAGVPADERQRWLVALVAAVLGASAAVGAHDLASADARAEGAEEAIAAVVEAIGRTVGADATAT